MQAIDRERILGEWRIKQMSFSLPAKAEGFYKRPICFITLQTLSHNVFLYTLRDSVFESLTVQYMSSAGGGGSAKEPSHAEHGNKLGHPAPTPPPKGDKNSSAFGQNALRIIFLKERKND